MLRRDQPPYPVESEAPQRFLGDLPVAVVGRIEGAAEQADAGARGWQAPVERRPQVGRRQAGRRQVGRRLAGRGGTHEALMGALAVMAGDRKSTRLNSVTNAHLVCRLLLE